MNIFVGNLSHHTSEKQLHDLFSEFGTVASVKIITDNFTRRPKGFAFVEMPDKDSGERAVEKLNNTSLNTQSMVVNEARPKNSQFNYPSSNSNRRY